MSRKEYEKELETLQVELCKLQEWVKYKGLRVDRGVRGPRWGRQRRHHQGHHGTCQSTRLSRRRASRAVRPREDSDVPAAIPRTFPAAGEIVIFDRSWYNRAGVEYVMGFCNKDRHRRFLELCPVIRRLRRSRAAFNLIKFWLEVGNEEQERRFKARIEDPLRQWKLSPMDLPSRSRWYDYSRARDMMLEATDTEDVSLVHRAVRRQKAGPPELHLAPL